MINPHILREYDIRGEVNQTLFPSDGIFIGNAFGHYMKSKGLKTVCVGYDGRLTSTDLEKFLIEGLQTAGVEIIRTGLGPTPQLYFAVQHYKTDAGIMVTGSHNPSTHNGFKICLAGKPFFGEDIQRLSQYYKPSIVQSNNISIKDSSPKSDYVSTLLSAYKHEQGQKIVWDIGHGAAASLIHELIDKLPGEHILMHDHIDGRFPAHPPDPTKAENLELLIEKVLQEEADIGIAFDGDADRIGVVDHRGNVLWGDQLLSVYAEEILKDNPGASIIADVKASQVLFNKIEQLGGKPVLWKTGHSHIKSKMKELNSPLAGEMSGHIFFADHYFGYDDALYAAIRLLNFLTDKSKKIADFMDDLPKLYNTPEIRLVCPDERKFAVVNEIKKRLDLSDVEYNDTDGIRVNTPSGWWLIRASNTQGELVLRCEDQSQKGLNNMLLEVQEYLKGSQINCSIYEEYYA